MFTRLLITFLLLGTTLQLSAQEITRDKVLDLMKERDRQIKELVGPSGTTHTDAQKAELRDMINDIIDYESMARIALQSTFDTISEEQRTEFVNLFSTIIRDQSLNNLDIYRAEVIYDEILINGNEAVVRTITVHRDVRTPVSYNLEYRDGDWFITDMAIDNVSTAESYRRSFQNMIRRRGFDALLDNLRTRAGA